MPILLSCMLCFSLWYMVENYLDDPAHNDFTEVEGDSPELLELRKDMIDMVCCIFRLPKLKKIKKQNCLNAFECLHSQFILFVLGFQSSSLG